MSRNLLLAEDFDKMHGRFLPPIHCKDTAQAPYGFEVENLLSEPVVPTMDLGKVESDYNYRTGFLSAVRPYIYILLSGIVYLSLAAFSLVITAISVVAGETILIIPTILFFVTFLALALIRVRESMKMHVDLSQNSRGERATWHLGRYQF